MERDSKEGASTLYSKADLEADLDILSYCFADQVRSKMEKTNPSEELQRRMAEILPRVRAVLADDEQISFTLEVRENKGKTKDGVMFANVRAIIKKKDGH